MVNLVAHRHGTRKQRSTFIPRDSLCRGSLPQYRDGDAVGVAAGGGAAVFYILVWEVAVWEVVVARERPQENPLCHLFFELWVRVVSIIKERLVVDAEDGDAWPGNSSQTDVPKFTYVRGVDACAA